MFYYHTFSFVLIYDCLTSKVEGNTRIERILNAIEFSTFSARHWLMWWHWFADPEKGKPVWPGLYACELALLTFPLACLPSPRLLPIEDIILLDKVLVTGCKCQPLLNFRSAISVSVRPPLFQVSAPSVLYPKFIFRVSLVVLSVTKSCISRHPVVITYTSTLFAWRNQ